MSNINNVPGIGQEPVEEAIQEWEDMDLFQQITSTVSSLVDTIDALEDPSDTESTESILSSTTEALPNLLEQVLVSPDDLHAFIRRISGVENVGPFLYYNNNRGGFLFEIAPFRNSIKVNLSRYQNSKDLKDLIKAIEKYKEILLRITERWTSLFMPSTSDTVANRYEEIDVILNFLKSQVEG
jgi:hypothetical protein